MREIMIQDAIRAAAKLRGMTNADIATALHINVRTLEGWLHRGTMSANDFVDICAVLGCAITIDGENYKIKIG